MHFDDRLSTVLEQPATGPHDRAVQWRQLVDLVARAPRTGDPLVARALERIAEARGEIDEPLRAAAARSIAGLPLSAELIALFAADRVAVAAPVLVAAQLQAAGWRLVWASATAETRKLIDAARPDVSALVRSVPAPTEPAGDPAPEIPSISELVARIERIRHARPPSAPERARAFSEPQPQSIAPPSSFPALFRWECGPSGEIDWVDGVPRGALVGRSIAGDEMARSDPAVGRAFVARAPFREGVLMVDGEGEVAGAWQVSGMPDFNSADGRFNGYRGIAWREARPAQAPRHDRVPPIRAFRDGDALRELVHEIRTPLNAIIGFAEIIDGQYFGPAHHSYRERAAEIVRQARHLLDAVEDLDFAAKLQSSRETGGEGTAFADMFPRLRDEFENFADERSVRLSIRIDDAGGRWALDRALAERLLSRFARAVIAAGDTGEMLELTIGCSDRHCTIGFTRPRSTLGMAEDELLDPAFSPGEVGGGRPVGLGFALRLLRGLISLVGGGLIVDPERLTLLIPLADDS